MKGAVWAVLGIVALNVLLVVVLMISAAVQRFRSAHAQRRLEARWRIAVLPPAAAIRRRRANAIVYLALVITVVFVASTVATGLRTTHGVTAAVETIVQGGGRPLGPSGDRLVPPAADRSHATAGEIAAGATQPSSDTPQTTASTSDAAPPAGSPDTHGDDRGAPSTVAAVSTSSTSIKLHWTEVPAASGYQVYRSTGRELWHPVGSTPSDDTSYTDTGLASATTYFYKVVAATGTGPAPSDVVSATTDPGPPSAPTLTVASTTSDEVDLSWTDVDGATGYRIERSTDGSSDWTTIATTGQDVTSYGDAGLSAATIYYFRVFATNADGDSSASNVVSATTLDRAPVSQIDPAGTAT